MKTLNKIRSPRPDEKLGNLTASQLDQVKAWLLAPRGGTFAAVKARLGQEFNLRVSVTALHNYWRKHVLPALDLPRKAPVEYTLESYSVLKRQGKVLARTQTQVVHLHHAGSPLRKRDALALMAARTN
jgi:hypothetical protein